RAHRLSDLRRTSGARGAGDRGEGSTCRGRESDLGAGSGQFPGRRGGPPESRARPLGVLGYGGCRGWGGARRETRRQRSSGEGRCRRSPTTRSGGGAAAGGGVRAVVGRRAPTGACAGGVDEEDLLPPVDVPRTTRLPHLG